MRSLALFSAGLGAGLRNSWEKPYKDFYVVVYKWLCFWFCFEWPNFGADHVRGVGDAGFGGTPSTVHLFSFHACLTELVVHEEGYSAYKVALFFFCRLGWTLFKKRIAVFWVGRKCLRTSPSVSGSPDLIDHDKEERLVLRAAPISPSRYSTKTRDL